MNVWQKYISQVIALHSRGKALEENVRFKSLFNNRDMTPSQLLNRMQLARDAQSVYLKAQRICRLLEETKDPGAEVDIAHIANAVDSSVRRIGDIIKLLNSKAKKWGIEEEPKTKKFDKMLEPFTAPLEDAAEADDFVEPDPEALKTEIKHSLKALSNIVDYMETRTLLKIRKELDKIVGY